MDGTEIILRSIIEGVRLACENKRASYVFDVLGKEVGGIRVTIEPETAEPSAVTALQRFEPLKEAWDPSYPDDVIIRCEVTAGDIRAMVAALDSAPKVERKDG